MNCSPPANWTVASGTAGKAKVRTAGAAGTVTDSLPFSVPAVTVTPVPLAQARTGQRAKVPPAVTSTVVPRRAPAGKRYVRVGAAASAGETARRNAQAARARG